MCVAWVLQADNCQGIVTAKLKWTLDNMYLYSSNQTESLHYMVETLVIKNTIL